MRNSNYDPIKDPDRLILLESILPGVMHEISNNNQTILLTGQILLEIWEDLMPIIDLYFNEHGDFTAGGLQYSLIKGELSGYCTNVLTSSKKIERIVSEIRSFMNPDAEAGFQSFSLNRLIEATATLLANPIRKATDHLALELDSSIPDILGLPGLIVQLLLHLLLNACRSLGNRESSLVISTRHDTEESFVVCEIRDQGRGVAAKQLSRIRASLSGEQAYTGEDFAGLDAIRNIVSKHACRIDVHSEEGRGTRIILKFPVESIKD